MVLQKCKLPSTEEAINVGGIVIFFFIVSVSKFKGPNYIIPLFPFFAVIAAKWAVRLYEGFHAGTLKAVSIIQYVALVAIWCIIGYVVVVNISDVPILLSISIVFTLLLFMFALIKLDKKLHKMIVASCATIVALGLLFNTYVVPLTFDYHGIYQATKIVNKRGDSSSNFIYLHPGVVNATEDTFNFYLKPEVVYAQKVEEIAALQDGWVFAKEAEYKLIQDSNIQFSEVIKLPHLRNLGPVFLNPNTREKTFKYFYLLKK